MWDKATTTNNELREKKRKKSYQTDLKSENFKKGAICDLFNRISTHVDLIKDCQSLEERRPGNNVKIFFFSASKSRFSGSSHVVTVSAVSFRKTEILHNNKK